MAFPNTKLVSCFGVDIGSEYTIFMFGKFYYSLVLQILDAPHSDREFDTFIANVLSTAFGFQKCYYKLNIVTVFLKMIGVVSTTF